ncbi:MAG: hypothetical protein K6E41_03060 [Solobacterium sp.]|nr:hypothetical protein [Solobacterium sp.]
MTWNKPEWMKKYLDRKTVGLLVAGFLLICAGETMIELRKALKESRAEEAQLYRIHRCKEGTALKTGTPEAL